MDAKKLDTGSRDAISWLPDEVLGKILSLLPTKQAVSTSLLSKKWRYVFRLVDNLEFDDSVSEEGEQASYVFPESFKNCVDRTLALQSDSLIKKLSLKCHVGEDDECQKACVGRWISNVVERGVLELDLRIINERGEICLPPQLFACKTLVKLTLGTQLYLGMHPSYVSLPSLKFLFIDTIFEYDNFSCVFLAGCPVLQELSVHHKNFTATPHTISSPTVKRLLVNYDSPIDVDDSSYMSFDLPKLVYLEYSHSPLREYIQVNLESLVEAKLDLYPAGRVKRPDVTDLIVGIRNVEILHLSPVSADMIYSYCRNGLPMFDNLVNLSFGSTNKRGWKLLPYLLKQSPKLETLIVQDLNGYSGDVSMPLNRVKALHILDYRGTAEELKQLKSFLGDFKCLELVQVDVAEAAGIVSSTKRDLMMLLGVSLPSKCQFKGLDGYTGDVTMHPYQVKVLHVLGYKGTAQELEHLKNFLDEWQWECLELVQVEAALSVVVDDAILAEIYEDLVTLLGVSVSSECKIELEYFI